MIYLLQQPDASANAMKSLVDYGVVGAILVLCIIALVAMYKTANTRDEKRLEGMRSDMKSVADSNRAERDRWQQIDSQRFSEMKQISDKHVEAYMKNTDALAQLSAIIKERISK